MKHLALYALILISFLSCKNQQSDKNNLDQDNTVEQDGSILGIQVIDPSLSNAINPQSKVEVLTEKVFTWSEGPVWVESDNMLLFTDVPNNVVYKYSDASGLEKYVEPSGNTGIEEGAKEGANGLLLDAEGMLVLCQHGDRRVAFMDESLNNQKPNYVSLADSYDGKKFNSPNDAAYDGMGNLFFTDPPYGLTDGLDNSPRKELDFNGVFKLDTNGQVMLIDKSLTRPNGIAFSPDFKTMYVANSDPKAALWKAYPIDENGNILQGKIFADVTTMIGDKLPGLPDGLKVDDKGNLFATGPGGVLIFSPDGKHLGTIKTGKATANCAFNSDKSVLYMTAHDQLMRININ